LKHAIVFRQLAFSQECSGIREEDHTSESQIWAFMENLVTFSTMENT
jgi:hypothetical protein